MFFTTSPSRSLEARMEALNLPAARQLLEAYHAHLDERGITHRGPLPVEPGRPAGVAGDGDEPGRDAVAPGRRRGMRP